MLSFRSTEGMLLASTLLSKAGTVPRVLNAFASRFPDLQG